LSMVFDPGRTVYIAPEIIELIELGCDIDALFLESHTQGDSGIYAESVAEIMNHAIRVTGADVVPVISAHRVEEHKTVVVFVSDPVNQITHVFGLKMSRCGETKGT